MTPFTPDDAGNQPPLLQQLAGMGLLDSQKPAAGNIAESLGDLINLSNSISLASALSSLKPVSATENFSFEKPQQQFLNARGGMIRFITRSFEPEEHSIPFMLPVATRQTVQEPEEGFKPFQRFYSLHQSEMDHRIARLRKSLRASLAAENETLGRLAALDRIVDDTLADHARRVLVILPKLLGDHFHRRREAFMAEADAESLNQPAAWIRPGAWLSAFHQDMRQLLLLELDFRLLPARAILDVLSPDTTETGTKNAGTAPKRKPL